MNKAEVQIRCLQFVIVYMLNLIFVLISALSLLVIIPHVGLVPQHSFSKLQIMQGVFLVLMCLYRWYCYDTTRLRVVL